MSQSVITFGIEVKRLRCRPVTAHGAGSTPVSPAMSKRYSESLIQDLNNESAECLRREWDIVGIKESDTPPPSSVDFLSSKMRWVFERKNCEYPLTIISSGENAVVAQLVELVPSKYEVAGSNPVYRSKLNKMANYRKKPVVIEAIQLTVDNVDLLVEFCGDKIKSHPLTGVVIETLEGDMLASQGDYIIKGIKGEFYPCKPDIFDATYELVD